MIMYHGTSELSAERILRSGRIYPRVPAMLAKKGDKRKPVICLTTNDYVAKAFGPKIFRVELDSKDASWEFVGPAALAEVRITRPIYVPTEARLLTEEEVARIQTASATVRFGSETYPLAERRWRLSNFVKRYGTTELYLDGDE